MRLRSAHPGYIVANLVEIARRGNVDLHGVAFTGLPLDSVDFRDIDVRDADCSASEFRSCVFGDNFGPVTAVAHVNAGQELLAAGTFEGFVRLWTVEGELQSVVKCADDWLSAITPVGSDGVSYFAAVDGAIGSVRWSNLSVTTCTGTLAKARRSMGNNLTRRELLAGVVAGTTLRPSESLRWAKPSSATQAPIKADSSCEEKDEIFYDEHGLIVQRNCDGGDTAQREGMYWFGNWVRMNLSDLRHLGGAPDARRYGHLRKLQFRQVLDLLEDSQKTGRFRRHPHQTQAACDGCKAVNDPDAMSRDQMIPLIAAMGVQRDFDRLDRFTDQSAWTLNKDLMLFFGEFIKRAKEQDLALGGEIDKFILDRAVDLHFRNVKNKGMDEVGDDLNLIVQLLLAVVRQDAKVKAIRARYVRDRPKNYGVYLTRYREAYPNDFSADKDKMIQRIDEGVSREGWKPDCTSVLGALKWYFRRETGGSPGIPLLYKPIMDAYFAGPIPN